MVKRYLIGISILLTVIIISWLVSALGSEKYTIVDMATTTTTSLNNLGTTTLNSTSDRFIDTATTTE